MPSKHYQLQRNFGKGVRPWDKDIWSWSLSPRVNGKLVLAPQTFSRQTIECSGSPGVSSGNFYLNGSELPDWSFPGVAAARASAYNTAYSKFRGQLYKGKASLGVTIASAKQTREMVAKRFHVLDTKAERALRALELANRSRRPARDLRQWAANFHLEVIFGWVPLVQDAVAATTTVIQQADPMNYIRGSHTVYFDKVNVVRYAGHQCTETPNARIRVTVAAGVRITNRNRWLAERAGLANPAAVAWDLVPWSFVVNMFANTSALVNSLTDFSGLEFSRTSTTDKFWGLLDSEERGTSSSTNQFGYYGTVRRRFILHRRSVGGLARPSLEFRMPDFSWGTAAMAASLFSQKFGLLSKAYSRITGR